ncbi:sybindin-like family protein [Aspergillus flavus]|uniref:Trafficking protein particle complex subunit n=1 Tax=Aspergillus flavus TaxID=5059 RepID=A0AB74CKU6_ASPFL|nr:sybindin-like family protein [Aspergillus flavus]RAQ56640.1 sybindin-like family protein [Aspergillus flavus]RMZ47074.1 sybindin-like family protein [Aspergillus flavus]
MSSTAFSPPTSPAYPANFKSYAYQRSSKSPGENNIREPVHPSRCFYLSAKNVTTKVPVQFISGDENLEAVFSLIIINKAGGLVYQREFQPGLRKLSTNDYLVLAGTFHGVHAITRTITPKLPLSTASTTATTPTSSNIPSTPGTPTPPTPASAFTFPNPGIPATGLESLETDKFRLTCFQTLTGTKFLLFTDPMMGNIDVVMKKVYELYADYVMKNPFYQLEMPVRCEAFDRHLAGWLRGRT